MGGFPMILVLLLVCLPGLRAQPARALDSVLQGYAYRAFIRPKTGVVYRAEPPSNLTEVKIYALRLKNGSLRTRGVALYNEFHIPVGVLVEPYVERIVLVYQNLGNLSSTFYPLPGFTYLAPVLGLLAYSASNLSASNLPELSIRTSGDPITVNFSRISSIPQGLSPRCVFFNLSGSPIFSSVNSGNVCNTSEQGHFSIVAKVPGKKKSKKVGIVVGSVIGGVLLLALLMLLVMWVCNLRKRKTMQRMEKEAELGETLQMTTVGSTRAPSAMVTRTQPSLENEYVP